MATATSPVLTALEREAFLGAQIDTLAGIYRSRSREIQRLLTRSRNLTDASRARHTAILAQVNREVTFLDRQARLASPSLAANAYRRGQEIAGDAIVREGLADAVDFGARVHTAAVSVVADQIALDLLTANGTIRRTSARFIRATQQRLVAEEVLNQAIANNLIAGGTRRGLSDVIETALWEQIDDGRLITINGRHYDPEAYSRLVARTRTREATTQGTVNTALQFGMDLVRVSVHAHTNTKWDRCGDYAGRVYSISGTSDVFPRLEKAPPFHPNCEHVISPVDGETLKERDGYDALVARSNDGAAADVQPVAA